MYFVADFRVQLSAVMHASFLIKKIRIYATKLLITNLKRILNQLTLNKVMIIIFGPQYNAYVTNYRSSLTFIARWSLRADECNTQHPQYTHPHNTAGRHDLSKVVLFLRG